MGEAGHIKYRIVLLAFLLIPLLSPTNRAEYLTPYLYIYSPRSAAMGGCAAALADEYSFEQNPGSMGIYHFDKFAVFTFPVETNLNKQMYFGRNSDKVGMNAFGGSINLAEPLFHGDTTLPNMTLGFGFREIRHTVTGDYGEDSYLKRQYSLFIGLEYLVRLGLGFNYRHVISPENYWPYDAFDYGVMLELPLMKILAKGLKQEKWPGGSFNISLTPAFGIYRVNDAESMDIDQLMLKRTGWSLSIGLGYKEAELISGLMTFEKDKYGRIGYPYYIPTESKKRGFEIGIFGGIYYRRGRTEEDVEFDKRDFLAEEVIKEPFNTSGYGFRINGLLKCMLLNPGDKTPAWLKYLVRHWDVGFDHAKYREGYFFLMEGGPTGTYGGTIFRETELSRLIVSYKF